MLLTSILLACSLVVYAAALAASAGLWRAARRFIGKLPPAAAADLALLLEIGPVLAAMIVPLLFLLPGFVEWEPAQSRESIPLFLMTLAAVCLLGVALGSAHFARDLYVHVRSIRRVCTAIETSRNPLIAVTGFLRSKVLVSPAAAAALSAEELKAVLAHEALHIARRDNLRELLGRIAAALRPNLRVFHQLRSARLHWAEQAADAGAARDAETALHLASALVRLARLSVPVPEAIATFFLPDVSAASVSSRVMRLLGPATNTRVRNIGLVICACICALLLGAAMQTSVQYACHQLLERIVAL